MWASSQPLQLPASTAAALVALLQRRLLAASAVAAVRAAQQPPRHVLRLGSRRVPTDDRETEHLQRKPAAQPEQKRLRVTVLGIPNSGKSTLVNRLLQWPVCSVSSKVHTTQTSTRTSLTVGNTQLVLEDTPGLVTEAEQRRHNLTNTILSDPGAALRRADLVCVLHDVSDPRCRAGLSPKVQRMLFAEPRRSAVLVLTKVDALVQKRRLLELTDRLTEGVVDGQQLPRQERRPQQQLDVARLLGRSQSELPKPQLSRLEQLRAQGVEIAEGFVDRGDDVLPPADPDHRQLVLSGGAEQLSEQQLSALARSWRSWPLFRRVFMTSALEDRGVAELCQFLLSAARPAGWRFSSELVTDKRPRQLAADIVRATLLDSLPAEVPYGITALVTSWEHSLDGEVLAVEMRLQCRKLAHSRLLLNRIRAVARASEQALRDAFRCEITLRLNVQPTPDSWSRDPPAVV